MAKDEWPLAMNVNEYMNGDDLFCGANANALNLTIQSAMVVVIDWLNLGNNLCVEFNTPK